MRSKSNFNLFIAVFALTVLVMSFASAADVAYFYERSFNVDQNVINIFTSQNLTVDLINGNAIPANFNYSKYRLLYIGDENFDHPELIPVGKIPTVFSNYYQGEFFGLTDNEGVSQLASNQPLSVNKNNSIIPVYTKARNGQGVNIAYYYLDKLDKSPRFIEIAGTYTGRNSQSLGDVVTYANPGARLVNGKILQSKLCFFGIIESPYWTPAAKAMFSECANFVSSVCRNDNECMPSNTTAPFCKNGDVYITNNTNTCVNPGTPTAQCVPHSDDILQQHCELGCENGQCINGRHDVAIIDSANSINKISITNSQGTPVINSSLACGNIYTISSLVKNKGNFAENITFTSSFSNLSFTFAPVSNLGPEGTSLLSKTLNVTLSSGSYTIALQANIANDQNTADNSASRSITVNCPLPTIVCSNDLECGISNSSAPFCTANNVSRTTTNFTCINPGTPNSFCVSNTTTSVVQSCTICQNGQCQTPTCNNNSDCIDSNPRTIDECINPGTIISECRHTPINCANNLDCGSTGFIGTEFCSANDVYKNFQNSTCINPGTTNSFCSVIVNQTLVQDCPLTCSNGQCITCNTNQQCDDNNSTTLDLCNNPGTPSSFCTNTPIDIICNRDLDCGTSGYTMNNTCFGNNVTNVLQNFTCHNPGTVQSFCSSTARQVVIEQCSNTCSEGQCVDSPVCGNNIVELGESCDDGNNINGDGCSSVCTVELQKPTLNCRISSSCNQNETEILSLAKQNNSHAALPGTDYGYSVCCSTSQGSLSSSCTNGTPFLHLSSETNAHVEKVTENNYAINACIKHSTRNITCSYRADCLAEETCLGSIVSDTNAHISECSFYPTDVCCATQ